LRGNAPLFFINNQKSIKKMSNLSEKDFAAFYEAYNNVYASQEVDEATAMAKRGLDEPAIRQQIAKNTGGGQAADRATALADKQTYGQSGVNPAARQKLAAKQRGDFRNTTSSNPGLHGYAHKATTPADKAKQAARGAQRGVLTPAEKKNLNMSYESEFDAISEYLFVEGYADTIEAAELMAANIGEEWSNEILEAVDWNKSEIGITGKPVPKKNLSAKNRHEFEKKRRSNLKKEPGTPGDSPMIQALRQKAKDTGNYAN
jgi:hypothetical protein